jgi:hypothetical protein
MGRIMGRITGRTMVAPIDLVMGLDYIRAASGVSEDAFLGLQQHSIGAGSRNGRHALPRDGGKVWGGHQSISTGLQQNDLRRVIGRPAICGPAIFLPCNRTRPA